jgi:5-methyltetrahydropteroyltriglutamate--homocysteine methyltransferase
MTPHYEGLLGNKQLGVGAVDVQDPKIESGKTVAERVQAHKWLTPEQTIVTSSCGFNHLPRRIAFGKLQAIVDAKRILGG